MEYCTGSNWAEIFLKHLLSMRAVVVSIIDNSILEDAANEVAVSAVDDPFATTMMESSHKILGRRICSKIDGSGRSALNSKLNVAKVITTPYF